MHSRNNQMVSLLLLLSSSSTFAMNPSRETEISESQLNPPWQATNPTNLNPLGLPPEQAGKDGVNLRGGAYPSGRAIATQKYGLIDNPQNVHAIGPNYGIKGGVNAPTDRPRFYPQDFLTAPEPSTVTPPVSFKASNPLFNPNSDDGFTPGEMEPNHPEPCSVFDSNGTGLCNNKPLATKSSVDALVTGPDYATMVIKPTKPLGKRRLRR